jgi:hypothetical protein
MGDELRRFDSAAINAAIEKALTEVPAGKSGAVVAFADNGGAGLAVAARLGEGWSFVGKLERPWNGALEAEAQLRWTW